MPIKPDPTDFSWFTQLASAQITRLTRRFDAAAVRIRAADRPGIYRQRRQQGDIVIASGVLGGLDEQASLHRTVRGNAMGKRKPNLSELDHDYK